MGVRRKLLELIAANVQFGSGGPILEAVGAKLKVTDSGGTISQLQAAAGVADDDVPNMSQLNAVTSSIKRIANVKMLGDADRSLTGLPTSIDGISISADDRVLLTGQTTLSENGPWIAKAGAWQRPTDFPVGGAAAGITVHVEQGTTYGNDHWTCSADSGSDVIDTNDLAWVKTSGSGTSKEKWSTYHNFNQTSTIENYIPINDLSESTGDDYYHRVLTRQVPSKIVRIVMWPAAIGCGDTVFKAYQYDKPQSSAIATLRGTSPTVDMDGTGPFTFSFSSPPLFSANELAGVSIDTSDDGPDQSCMRIDWEEQ